MYGFHKINRVSLPTRSSLPSLLLSLLVFSFAHCSFFFMFYVLRPSASFPLRVPDLGASWALGSLEPWGPCRSFAPLRPLPLRARLVSPGHWSDCPRGLFSFFFWDLFIYSLSLSLTPVYQQTPYHTHIHSILSLIRTPVRDLDAAFFCIM